MLCHYERMATDAASKNTFDNAPDQTIGPTSMATAMVRSFANAVTFNGADRLEALSQPGSYAENLKIQQQINAANEKAYPFITTTYSLMGAIVSGKAIVKGAEWTAQGVGMAWKALRAGSTAQTATIATKTAATTVQSAEVVASTAPATPAGVLATAHKVATAPVRAARATVDAVKDVASATSRAEALAKTATHVRAGAKAVGQATLATGKAGVKVAGSTALGLGTVAASQAVLNGTDSLAGLIVGPEDAQAAENIKAGIIDGQLQEKGGVMMAQGRALMLTSAAIAFGLGALDRRYPAAGIIGKSIKGVLGYGNGALAAGAGFTYYVGQSSVMGDGIGSAYVHGGELAPDSQVGQAVAMAEQGREMWQRLLHTISTGQLGIQAMPLAADFLREQVGLVFPFADAIAQKEHKALAAKGQNPLDPDLRKLYDKAYSEEAMSAERAALGEFQLATIAGMKDYVLATGSLPTPEAIEAFKEQAASLSPEELARHPMTQYLQAGADAKLGYQRAKLALADKFDKPSEAAIDYFKSDKANWGDPATTALAGGLYANGEEAIKQRYDVARLKDSAFDPRTGEMILSPTAEKEAKAAYEKAMASHEQKWAPVVQALAQYGEQQERLAAQTTAKPEVVQASTHAPAKPAAKPTEVRGEFNGQSHKPDKPVRETVVALPEPERVDLSALQAINSPEPLAPIGPEGARVAASRPAAPTVAGARPS